VIPDGGSLDVNVLIALAWLHREHHFAAQCLTSRTHTSWRLLLHNKGNSLPLIEAYPAYRRTFTRY
jgi:hypothetical protein